MSKPERRQRISPKARLEREAMADEAAFAPLAREFVRLLRDGSSKEPAEYWPAYRLAEWLYEHRLNDIERNYFIERTGWIFECELPPENGLRRAPGIEPNPTDPPSAELTDPEIPF